MLLSLAACSGDSTPDNTEKQNINNANNNNNDNINTNQIQFTEAVAIDNAECTVKFTGIDPDNMWGYTLNVLLVNKTDKNVMFTVEDVSVNGFMAEPLYADSGGACNCAFSSISWADYILEENKIINIEEIEFVLQAYDEDNWETDDFVSQKITLHP